MKRTTYHKNPSGSASDPPETTLTDMAENATSKVTGLVRQGGAVIGGQVAASVLTKMALDKFGGAKTAPGTTGRNLGNVALPIALGMGVLAFSKNEDVQNAGLGCVVAGVGSGVRIVLGENSAQFPFFPADEAEEMVETAGYYELPPASADAYALAEASQAVHEVEVVSIDDLN